MARKRSTKRTNPTIQAYNRERNRIQRQLNRMLARGYIIPADILPARPKKITAGSVRRLKKITSKKLYDQSDFTDLTTGEVLTGQEGRQLERKRGAQKAAQTRKRRRLIEGYTREVQERARETGQEEDREEPEVSQEFEDQIQQVIDNNRAEMEERWQQQRAQQDAEERAQMEREEYAAQFSTAELTRQNVEATLDNMRQDFPNTVSALERMIENAIGDEGEDNFWERMSYYDNIVEALQEVFYKKGDHISPTAYTTLESAIKGRAMSAQESRDAQDRFEHDQGLAFDIDEEP